MSAVRALFAGPGARRALADGARGEVELVLSGGGGYVRLGSSAWLLLAGREAPFGPLSVAVDALERLALAPGTPAHVTGGLLVLGDGTVSLSFERVRDRASVAICAPAPHGPGAIRAAVATELPAAPAPLRPGLAALSRARVADGVRLLAGLGEGLTPAGDDVLAGYAAARRAAAAPVVLSELASDRSSALGLAYLRCAERGELPDAGARLLDAICRGSVAGARDAVAPLRSWGASSGFALAWGINVAVLQLSRARVN
jgi:Protein of unknown function (DUF2877)